MNDKYYTPEIEEFHVGFEYEWKNPDEDNIWREAVMEYEDVYHACQDTINNLDCKYRVKYLDREDIESLGYGIIQNEYNCQWFKNASGNIEIGLEKDNHLTIRFTQSFVLFSGTIKNKSELKRIMKMIGI